MGDPIQFLLASRSPRRQELLSAFGWQFRVCPAEVDEAVNPGEDPASYVKRLAKAKACAVVDQAQNGWVVIGADTAVVDGRDILGKPIDRQDAKRILRRLRGHSHQVYSAVAAVSVMDGQLLVDVCRTNVPMRHYLDEEIEAYVASGDPMDKAGAYAIQHRKFRPVEHLHGCYANVVGLPLCHLTRVLRKLGFHPVNDIPHQCQTMLDYDCSVYKDYLF